MTNLKTLKDLPPCIDGVYHDNPCVERSKLKELAIKWVKEDMGIAHELPIIDSSVYLLVIKRWMKRLNITEEDLE